MGVKSRTRTGNKAREAAAEKAAASTKVMKRSEEQEDGSISPDDALKMMHWTRQALGITMGFLLGIVKITGFFAITSFFAVAVLVPNAYFASYLNVDEAEVAQAGSLKTEGLMPAFALFLLLWTLTYTTVV